MLDAVSVLRGSSVVQQFRELEIELLNGEDAFIERLVAAFHKVGARSHDGRPKLFRALSLSYDSPDAPAEDAPIGAHLRHSLSQQLQTLKQCDPGVRLGGETGDLHRIRVATRRMRTVLRAVRKIVRAEWVEPILSGLKWARAAVRAGARFGRANGIPPQRSRAIDGPRPATAGTVLLHLQSERGKLQQMLLNEMKSARYLGFLSKLQEAAELQRC